MTPEEKAPYEEMEQRYRSLSRNSNKKLSVEELRRFQEICMRELRQIIKKAKILDIEGYGAFYGTKDNIEFTFGLYHTIV